MGLFLLALGVAFMAKGDLGVSMVVAPAYLIYLKVSKFWPLFTFGMAEYSLQFALLLVMAVVLRKFRISYLFSIVTAVLYGIILDGFRLLIAPLGTEGMGWRICYLVIGFLFSALGVAMMFHTYIAPEVYELFVKEVSGHFGVELSRFKTGYDCCSCLIGIMLSFAFFGLFQFEGVKLGTIICALLNGSMIGWFGNFMEKRWEFVDRLPFRKYFEG